MLIIDKQTRSNTLYIRIQRGFDTNINTSFLQNLYDVLGNDVVDEDEKPFVASKEVVKPQRSTKKSGIPPKADKTKARKNRAPKFTGNDAGLKHANKNRSVEGPRVTRRKGGKSKQDDRHSKTGRSETAKAQKSKLGDEARAQVEADEDVKEERKENAEEEEEEEDTTQYRGFEDYFKEVKQQRESLAAHPKVSAKPEDIPAEELIVKKEEFLIAPTSTKKVRSRARKEKKVLDIDITVAPENADGFDPNRRGDRRGGRGGRGDRGDRRGPRSDRSDRGDRRSPRGGRGGRGGRSFRGRGSRAPRPSRDAAKSAKPASKPASKSANKSVNKLTEENFPSL